MELAFEHYANLGAGINPDTLHIDDNSVYAFSILNGRLIAKIWRAPSGDVDWSTPVFETAFIATKDQNMSLMRLKSVPRVGMFGTWHQDTVYDGGEVVTPERQRFAIWDAINDIGKYLKDGSIQLDLDKIVSTANFTFENPDYDLSGEKESRLKPGMKLEMAFIAGDSAEYPMGVYYIDRVDMSTTGGTVSVDCRNISGKLLKDQSLDGYNSFPIMLYSDLVESLLRAAQLTDFNVQQSPLGGWEMGMEFAPEVDMLTALNEIISASLNWTVRETLDGQIVAGSILTYDPLKNMNSKYTFNRGTDLISRGVVRDDNGVYSRVCYQSRNTVTDVFIRVYAEVIHALEWSFAPNKTLYITAAENTGVTELQDLADTLAARMSKAGVMEQFSGPFRPHILPGDEAEIIADDGTWLLGMITTVNHAFGPSGYFTSFTVDSAGVLGKPQLRDMIERVSGTQSSSAKRLY